MASEAGDPIGSEQSPPTEPPESPQSSAEQRVSTEFVQALYEAHHRELLAFLIGVLRSGDAAEEVAQSTFRRLMEAGHEARTETIKGWLFKVGFHEAMALRRRQALNDRTLKKYSSCRPPVTISPASHDELVQREDVTKIKELLKELPPDQQHVVRQRIYEEKTFKVIADELGVPLGTVLTRMRLAMEKIEKWWGRDASQ